MENLFVEHPLPAGYSDFNAGVIVLPISINRYYDLFWSQEGPQLHEQFQLEKHANNKITEKGTWFSPPDEKFKNFLHSDCDA